MKKKFLLLIMSICILSTILIACGKTDKEQEDDNKPKVETKEDSSSENDNIMISFIKIEENNNEFKF